MAVSEDTTVPIKYRHVFWGELITGSKEELQQLGIGNGLLFPGEAGAPKRRVNTVDPRGFPCRLQLDLFNCGRYTAFISIPGREQRPTRAAFENWAPGVRMDTDCWWFDEYVGTGAALVAAGLVRAEHLPGSLGMGKVAVTIFADGTLLNGPRDRNNAEKYRMPGAKRLVRKSKTTFSIQIIVSEDEQLRRKEADNRADEEYELRMKSLPRPAPLVQKTRAAEAAKRRATMRLVWSRPAFQPALVL